jgi:hypothetical protein
MFHFREKILYNANGSIANQEYKACSFLKNILSAFNEELAPSGALRQEQRAGDWVSRSLCGWFLRRERVICCPCRRHHVLKRMALVYRHPGTGDGFEDITAKAHGRCLNID